MKGSAWWKVRLRWRALAQNVSNPPYHFSNLPPSLYFQYYIFLIYIFIPHFLFTAIILLCSSIFYNCWNKERKFTLSRMVLISIYFIWLYKTKQNKQVLYKCHKLYTLVYNLWHIYICIYFKQSENDKYTAIEFKWDDKI